MRNHHKSLGIRFFRAKYKKNIKMVKIVFSCQKVCFHFICFNNCSLSSIVQYLHFLIEALFLGHFTQIQSKNILIRIVLNNSSQNTLNTSKRGSLIQVWLNLHQTPNNYFTLQFISILTIKNNKNL